MPSNVLRQILPLIIAVLLIAGWCAPVSRADELILSNGDHLTGQLLKRADGKIYFFSPVLGQIVVPETLATLPGSPSVPVESLVGLPPQSATAKSSPAKPAAGVAATKPAPSPWKGQVEAGYEQFSGQTNSLSTTVRFTAEKIVGLDDFKFSGSYLYSESEHVRSLDHTETDFRWRHDLSKRTFVQALSTYYNDAVQQIDFDAEQNVGFGYKLINDARQVADIGGGLTAQYRHAIGVEPGMNYLTEFFQDYSYKLNSRFTLLENSNVLYSPITRGIANPAFINTAFTPRQAANYKYHFGTTLQGKMTDRISLNLRYEYDYDNVILEPNARGSHHITTSIAYGF